MSISRSGLGSYGMYTCKERVKLHCLQENRCYQRQSYHSKQIKAVSERQIPLGSLSLVIHIKSHIKRNRNEIV